MSNIPYITTDEYGKVLIVDDKPFLALGGELHNSSGSSLEYLEEVIWPSLRQLHGNFYLAPVYWECLEPEEGKYDFALVDGIIAQARREGVRLGLLWFGVWKNGASDYMPAWLKEDHSRYFLARDENGTPLNTVSPFCHDVIELDKKAYIVLMEHLKETDPEHTVIIMQVENEVGIWHHDRDFCDQANALFRAEIPAEIAEIFHKSGTWEEAFGADACSYFMGSAYAKAVEEIAAAGKAVYPLPAYVNCVTKNPNMGVSGGPETDVHPIWMKLAPSVDIYSPDVYNPDYSRVIGRFVHDGNPLFVPETICSADSASRAIYGVGKFDCIGFNPFGIERAFGGTSSLDGASNGFGGMRDTAPFGHYIRSAYEKLLVLWPKIREARAKGKIFTYIKEGTDTAQKIEFGGYQILVSYSVGRPLAGPAALRGVQLEGPASAGIIIEEENQLLIFAVNSTFIFSPGPGKSGVVFVQDKREFKVRDGKLVQGRILNGDERNVTSIGADPSIITVRLGLFE